MKIELTYTKVGDYYIPDLTAEPLPPRDQMARVGLMNNCKARGEEIIFDELIYS